ncbi:MAG: trypsin-like peptidase domain-containing protein [Nannocystaceae bacterium]
MKLVAVVLGVVVSVVALMSLLGLVTDRVWIQAGGALLVTAVVPFVLADRLLPKDGSPRPGLVSDVLALTWMGGATAALMLGTTLLQAPLTAQAARFDDQGWSRAAWGTRWAAGVETPVAIPVGVADEAEPAADAVAPVEPEVGPAKSAAAAAEAAPAAGAEYTPAPAKAPPRDRLEPAQLFRSWAPSVVTISVDTPMGSSMGTGFVIDDRGTIATNHHVVDGAETIRVKLFDGTKAERVELLETNEDDDLALLRMEADSLPPAVVLGVSDEVVVGEGVVVIGNPIGLEHTMTDGLVSSRRVYDGKKYIQMSAPVSPGNSGGPVFNEHGDVIGVTVAKLWGENLNLAIPIDVLKPMIKSEYPAARGFGESRW